MLSFPLKNFVISPYPLSISLKNSSFPFPNNTLRYNNKIQTTTLSISLSLIWSTLTKQSTLLRASSSDSVQDQEQEEEYQVLAAVRSEYNEILIVDTPKERMLLLDSTHNVHSILNKEQKWTGSYWDEFASLPAIIPKGPIAILGLGGGTAAHLLLDLWPSLQLEGWEIDPILIDKARQHFGLSDLEKHTAAGGILQVHIGDALAPSENYSGRYAGIVIDLFYEGKVLAELQEVVTWLELNDRLMASGRFMVNCGGINSENSDNNADNIWIQNSTIKTLSEAFPGQVSWKIMPQTQGANCLALTGPFPDLTLWSSKLSYPLSQTVRQWRPCASIA